MFSMLLLRLSYLPVAITNVEDSSPSALNQSRDLTGRDRKFSEVDGICDGEVEELKLIKKEV